MTQAKNVDYFEMSSKMWSLIYKTFCFGFDSDSPSFLLLTLSECKFVCFQYLEFLLTKKLFCYGTPFCSRYYEDSHHPLDLLRPFLDPFIAPSAQGR
ncbi:hypothetical protein SAMN05216417_10689 [Nitrosospira multiformis]|uniref:Uncharacterized protein n=1 Tax=Nitrosospira multiformis TaxID=1231 RepID=A0A1I7GYY8_9PROT|nr:hypothetical protein SAMN05216417_10689 [Nitrosospira multiformis]